MTGDPLCDRQATTKSTRSEVSVRYWLAAQDAGGFRGTLAGPHPVILPIPSSAQMLVVLKKKIRQRTASSFAPRFESLDEMLAYEEQRTV